MAGHRACYGQASVVHELSIAVSLVDLACEEAGRQGDVRINALHLRLGALSGVVEEALTFSFALAAEGTAAAAARLDIERVPVVVRCAPCGEDRELPDIQHFRCPACGAPTPDLVRGREIELVAMEVTDGVAAHR